MASYKVEWTRPTVFLDNAGMAVDGFQVRITIYPWNEARDLNVKNPSAEVIHDLATEEIKRRSALDKLTEVEIEIEE